MSNPDFDTIKGELDAELLGFENEKLHNLISNLSANTKHISLFCLSTSHDETLDNEGFYAYLGSVELLISSIDGELRISASVDPETKCLDDLDIDQVHLGDIDEDTDTIIKMVTGILSKVDFGSTITKVGE
ncbi:hypothetical protein VCHA53O466_320005 [Vibrio chagasii]|nr:hypothetical protein VCHA53O466_320005 [Vibrio chagasii]